MTKQGLGGKTGHLDQGVKWGCLGAGVAKSRAGRGELVGAEKEPGLVPMSPPKMVRIFPPESYLSLLTLGDGPLFFSSLFSQENLFWLLSSSDLWVNDISCRFFGSDFDGHQSLLLMWNSKPLLTYCKFPFPKGFSFLCMKLTEEILFFFQYLFIIYLF